ncbi:MAG TPA: endolytic transglycosylase MltG, partial [Gemmatimonadales bacterium]|nr:endolytic transglycosylase MltG [Gemmatimonadales bacterium]
FTLGCRGRSGSEQVTVPAGASVSQVADSLAAHHLISSRLWFRLLARLSGADRSIHAGVYQFDHGTSTSAILDALRAGRVAAVKFTVPEGLTIGQIADLAQERLGVPVDSFETAATDSALADSLGLSGPTLEGFLHPDTYFVPRGISAGELVRLMTHEFDRRWLPDWTAQLDSIGLTRRQVVTLASIVEGEARVDSERPIIAGVYLNRLRIGMPLQADPTVQYALEQSTGHRKPRLYEKDYLTPSAYNTYLNPGLPPGPVNSPGVASIEAVLHPAPVPWLYFVADSDGHHLFARNYHDHLRNVARVRRESRSR